jgi:hypothetical protein
MKIEKNVRHGEQEFINAQYQEVMLNMSLPWVTFARSPNHFIKIPVVIAVITEIGIFSAIVLYFFARTGKSLWKQRT